MKTRLYGVLFKIYIIKYRGLYLYDIFNLLFSEKEKTLTKIRRQNNSSRDKKKIQKIEGEIAELKKKKMDLNESYSILKKPENEHMLPNMKKLLLLATLSPVGNAVVERLFSLVKITKTILRNSLSDKTLDILLR